MEDIEDLLVGSGGAPPGFRLPVPASVGVNTKKKNNKQRPNLRKNHAIQSSLSGLLSPKIPGTEIIYMKTFGCSHNQSDSEYMAGQLSAFGYGLSDNPEEADLWLINTCTVKSPSQSAMDTLISKCRSAKKPLVVAGCVPQGSRDLKELEGVSVVGVQQIDRVVEVVEETLKGHEVRLLNRKTLPALDLPKVARVRAVVTDGVKEIWLSSEDTGAYGRDIGANLPMLLKAIVAELPSDGSTMLRVGMTNPPYILEHLKEIADVLCHPCVYSFLHVPVQSGSDRVLSAMKREYTVSEFRKVVDTLNELVPGMQIATDIICGFPGEADEDFAETVSLIDDYKFSQVHISQFYPRPGTPAARMKKVPSTLVKKRSRELTSVFESFRPYNGMEGKVERIWITEIATDGKHLVGHTKGYVQVLVVGPETMLGTSAIVKITSVGRWSVFGEVIEILTQTKGNPGSRERESTGNKCKPCPDPDETCACAKEPQPCACEMPSNGDEAIVSLPKNEIMWTEERTNRNVIRWLLRKRRNQKRMENGIISEPKENHELDSGRTRDWALFDWALLGGAILSLLTVIVLLLWACWR
ncbi:uncharacterized protein LOC131311453 isoform X2 [Rhododendron vialii]|uniref:uncharacterized protein LOC131311453 isoform X2 n=1 Tax=Rhododendron vialii TaxID=182163 RepID=UPI00265F9DDF|nr:uncharacterized protein LOC131311453 isoform X2 [Rhododendron vialii]